MKDTINRRPLYAITGCSGSGKSTIAKYLHELYGLQELQSYTTREPRYLGEKGHEFISEAQYRQMVEKAKQIYHYDFTNRNRIVAYNETDGNRYFATFDQINKSDIYVIDPAGIQCLKANPCLWTRTRIVLVDCSMMQCYNRMRKRGMDKQQAISRLEQWMKQQQILAEILENKNRNGFVMVDNSGTGDASSARIAAREIYKNVR